ncbi:MAG TPA: hypothetical protein VHB21_21775, partial [Minicystis sp.]|nr:hypothetical protein [Minicystis sp.]
QPALARRKHDVRPRRPKPTPKRAIIIGSAAGGLALAAIVVGVAWPSAPPITARPRADAQGREALEIRCATCPDGTKVSIDGKAATIDKHAALVPLATELAVGDTRLKVALDRPHGRAETANVSVHVGYRIRPDLGTLEGDRPAISIVAEAARGTTMLLDGKPLALVDGRGLEKIDVADALTGISEDVKTLTRQVPYTVTPDGGAPETGTVSVSVGIVPLYVDAPGPRITTDQATFVLAGRTMKGAEILAAGRPIPVKADGTFAQVMNVSSVGATQIEVRARMSGMAPRLSPIRVRRVDSLDAAAKEFLHDEQPADAAALVAGEAPVGKPVVVTGDVLEARRQGYQTIVLVNVPKSSGCGDDAGCTVRLVVGGESAAKKGDKLRAFGVVAPPFSADGKKVPEVRVEFTTKGAP